MTAARDVTDFKTRLELLQEKIGKWRKKSSVSQMKMGSLSVQYEQRAAELAQLEEELEALRSQKERPKPKARQPVAAVENPPAKAAGVPKAVQEPAPPTPREERGNATKPAEIGAARRQDLHDRVIRRKIGSRVKGHARIANLRPFLCWSSWST